MKGLRPFFCYYGGKWRAAPKYPIPRYSVDPPYNNQYGRIYRHKFSDYEVLGQWCQSRPGQVIVCEQEGADWLPFTPFIQIMSNQSRTGRRFSSEAIWTTGNRPSDIAHIPSLSNSHQQGVR